MLAALKGCMFALTDSGGLQREAYYLRKRCLIRQNSPFWPCLTQAGIHRVVGKDPDDLKQGLAWIEDALVSDSHPIIDDLGKGDAVARILQNIVKLTTVRQSGFA